MESSPRQGGLDVALPARADRRAQDAAGACTQSGEGCQYELARGEKEEEDALGEPSAPPEKVGTEKKPSEHLQVSVCVSKRW